MTSDRMALRAFRHLVVELFGLEFTPATLAELQAALRQGLETHRLRTLEALFHRLEGEDPAGEAWRPVRERLTVGETFFFRDAAQLETIRSQVFLPIATQERPRRIRLWSAGCSTGEEAYSLAIMALGIFPEAEGWHVEVLGTDIHEGSLAQAKRGIYREWSFRGVPAGFREQWFHESKGHWQLQPAIRHHVQFKLHNLVQDPFEPLAEEGFDLILCRNVFIYFPLPQRLRIAQAFMKALRPKGALVLGHSELGHDVAGLFRVEKHPDSIMIRPEGHETPAAPLRPAPQPCPPPIEMKPRQTSPAKHHPPKPRNLIKEASDAMAAGEHGRALKISQSLVTANPRQEEAVRLNVQSLANLGKLAEAQAMLTESLARNPLSVPLNYLHSLLASEQGQTSETLKSLDRVLYLEPDHVAARMDRAHLFEVQNRLPDAARDLDRAIEILGRMDGQDPVPDLEPFRCEEVLTRCRALRERCRQAATGRAEF